MSKTWLWQSRNAFLVSTDPATGKPWPDRHGIAYGKKLKKVGNIETFLSYKKLHRTGKLLKNLSVNVRIGNSTNISLNNRVRYAKDHQEGTNTSKRTVIKEPYIRGGAHAVVTGGSIEARPFMTPSKKVLTAPYVLVVRKMRSLGWTLGN